LTPYLRLANFQLGVATAHLPHLHFQHASLIWNIFQILTARTMRNLSAAIVLLLSLVSFAVAWSTEGTSIDLCLTLIDITNMW